jgi:integrase
MLSETRANKISKPGRYTDGRNLYLKITKGGSRSWQFRYELHGRERVMGLGACDDFTLEEAREKARLARQLLWEGIDPLEKLHERRAEHARNAAKLVTFEEATDRYLDFHRKKWTHARYRNDQIQKLKTYAFPIIGKLMVGAIDKALVLKCITPIWETKNASAVRTLALIKGVLDYAKVSGWGSGENPAAWSGNLAHALPKLISTNKHHPALPFADVADFMMKLRSEPGIAARALEFLILTATRTGETQKAKWSEIDFAAKTWTIPAARMKSDREHRVPLSPRALEILQALPREGDWVFIGALGGKPISEKAMSQTLKRLQPDVTCHGFRSCFRDWSSECTSYPNHVCKMALAHAIGNAVEKSYRRGDLFAKRTKLMSDWAKFCAMPPRADEDTVVPIRAHR